MRSWLDWDGLFSRVGVAGDGGMENEYPWNTLVSCRRRLVRRVGGAQLIDVVLPLTVACTSAKLSLMSMVGASCDEQLLWGGLG